MSLIPDGDDPPSRTEVRQLEERVDARFQAVNARFTTMDRRSAGVVTRIDETEQVARSLTTGCDSMSRNAAARFDATDARIDLTQVNTTQAVERLRRDQDGRLLVLTLGIVPPVVVITTALTIWLVP